MKKNYLEKRLYFGVKFFSDPHTKKKIVSKCLEMRYYAIKTPLSYTETSAPLLFVVKKSR